jgi:hypothetical protein
MSVLKKHPEWLIHLLCLTPLSAIFQLYHGDQFKRWKKPEYPERTTDHEQATGKLYHLRLRVECTLFCNLQSRIGDRLVWVVRYSNYLIHWAAIVTIQSRSSCHCSCWKSFTFQSSFVKSWADLTQISRTFYTILAFWNLLEFQYDLITGIWNLKNL